jgi:hypothetical protein
VETAGQTHQPLRLLLEHLELKAFADVVEDILRTGRLRSQIYQEEEAKDNIQHHLRKQRRELGVDGHLIEMKVKHVLVPRRLLMLQDPQVVLALPHLISLILAIIYYPYKTIIDFFIYLQKYDMFNCLVMIKKKRYQMRQCENYLRILKHEKPTRNQNMFDFHFYKMAIYSKFASLLTQMVLDIILGFLFLIYLRTQTTSAWNVLHYIGKGLQLEVLK